MNAALEVFGISVQEVARLLGVSVSHVYRLGATDETFQSPVWLVERGAMTRAKCGSGSTHSASMEGQCGLRQERNGCAQLEDVATVFRRICNSPVIRGVTSCHLSMWPAQAAPMMRRIACVLMRGGSSKGLYFRATDLPSDPSARDRVLLSAMGSPDRRQIDGLGGGDEQSSKVMIVGASSDPDVDVECLYAQVSVARDVVDATPDSFSEYGSSRQISVRDRTQRWTPPTLPQVRMT